MITFIAMFAIGWLTYTWIEYVLHRWGGHSAIWNKGWRAHMEHHSNPRYFPGTHQQVALLIIPLSIALYAAWGAAVSGGMVGGATFGFVLFEYTHRKLHNSERAPRTAYGRWLVLNHLHHHFVDGRTNHGITSPLWDLLLGTYKPVAFLSVRGRDVTIPPWLKNEGLPKALKNRIRLAQRQRDQARFG